MLVLYQITASQDLTKNMPEIIFLPQLMPYITALAWPQFIFKFYCSRYPKIHRYLHRLISSTLAYKIKQIFQKRQPYLNFYRLDHPDHLINFNFTISLWALKLAELPQKGHYEIMEDEGINCVMQKNRLKNYVQQPWQNKQRTQSFNSIKSEKVLKIFTTDSQNTKPFRRKQEPLTNNRKNQYNDIGKLISNTSFGKSPDIRKIIATSPKHYFDTKLEHQQKPDDKKFKPILRETKSFSDLSKATQMYNTPSMRIIQATENIQPQKDEQRTNIANEEIKQHNNESRHWKAKINQLTKQKKQLSQKCDHLSKKLQELQTQLAEKENTINQYNIEIMKKIDELEQQKDINRCLEDIVTQLNGKISEMLSKNEQYQKLCRGPDGVSKEDLEREVHELRQKVYNLNKTVHSLQVQTIIVKKIKHELEKEKVTNKCLQKQNKSLKERMLTMMKITRVKPAKLSLKQDLDYSVSFQFEH